MIATKQRFHLHYIGHQYYTRETFIREAKKIGIQRAVPFSQLKSLSFGEPILLANYIKKAGAEVFGVMILDGITTTLSNDLYARLFETLDVESVNSTSVVDSVERACGNYNIASHITINETVSSLCEKINDALTIDQNTKINPNEYKWFINGTFVSIEPFTVPAKFTRGITTVEVDTDRAIPLSDNKQKHLTIIDNYQKRRYMPSIKQTRIDKWKFTAS